MNEIIQVWIDIIEGSVKVNIYWCYKLWYISCIQLAVWSIYKSYIKKKEKKRRSKSENTPAYSTKTTPVFIELKIWSIILITTQIKRHLDITYKNTITKHMHSYHLIEYWDNTLPIKYYRFTLLLLFLFFILFIYLFIFCIVQYT